MIFVVISLSVLNGVRMDDDDDDDVLFDGGTSFDIWLLLRRIIFCLIIDPLLKYLKVLHRVTEEIK